MENAIVIRGVTKRFKKSTIRRDYTTFKTEFVRWVFGREQREERAPSWIEALRGVDLTVPKGKTVGIIGRNGSGKSTLLKIITGIYAPTSGTAEVKGRVSALLDLGAGFHPDFSGRENIMINGIILGMSRADVKARMQQIIDFSELGDFVDEPVRTYSSGMFARLAFAVATHVEPDILIIDEILAVGDEHFGRKSKAKMEEFKKAGRTIVLVTHDLGTVQSWCDEAAWLDGGKIRAAGAPHEVVEQYRQAVTLAEAQGTLLAPPAISPGGGALPSMIPPKPTHGPAVPSNKRSGDFRVEIERVRFLGRGGREASSFDTEDPLEVALDFVCNEPVPDVGFSVALSRLDGTAMYRTSTLVESFSLPSPLPPRGTIRLTIDRLGFTEGSFTVDVSAVTKAGQICDEHRGLYPLTVHSAVRDSGVARPPHRWRLDGAENQSVPLARVVAS